MLKLLLIYCKLYIERGGLLPVATVTAMRNYIHITSIGGAVFSLSTGLDVGARVHMEAP